MLSVENYYEIVCDGYDTPTSPSPASEFRMYVAGAIEIAGEFSGVHGDEPELIYPAAEALLAVGAAPRGYGKVEIREVIYHSAAERIVEPSA